MKLGFFVFTLVVAVACSSFGIVAGEEPAHKILLEESFEIGEAKLPAGWTIFRGETMARTKEAARTGEYSFRIEDRTSTGVVGLRSPLLPVEPGQEYAASAWVLVKEGVPSFYLEFWDEAKKTLGSTSVRIMIQGEWQETVVKKVAPANARYVNVMVHSSGANMGLCYFDDVQLAAGADPAKATATVLGSQTVSGSTDRSDDLSSDPVLAPDAVSVPAASARVLVHDAAELNRALAAAAPGQLIELADGTYNSGAVFTVRKVRGTKSAPLIIRAQNPGRAIIAGNSWFLVEDSSYVVIEDFLFTTVDDTNSFGVWLRRTSHSRVTRNRFALVESPANLSSRNWVYIDGTGADYNRIDHNYFEGKRRIGNFVSVDGDDVQVGRYNRIDRNHFKDARSVNSNGMEAIRIGTSGVSRSYAYAIVEYNLFEQCNGDAEIITVKSGGNQIRYNTFWECEGTMTLRHGNDNKVYGNYFLGNNKPLTGGVRVYGRGHEVYNNHFEGLEGTGSRSALTIGSADVENQEVILSYWRVERLLVAFNTFVNNRSSIAIAPDLQYPFAPISTVIANNLVVSDKPGPLVSVGKPAEITWRGNVMHAASSASVGINLTSAEIRNIDPQLILGVDGVHYVGARSPVIDAAQPILSSPVIGTDIEGKPRDTHPDVGAFEYAGYPLLRGPLTAAEVGPDAPPATASRN